MCKCVFVCVYGCGCVGVCDDIWDKFSVIFVDVDLSVTLQYGNMVVSFRYHSVD